jgi:molybdenum cofactor cytidylyltransferase
VPAVFSRLLFARLRALPAGGGAKHILADAALNLVTIDFPDGLADIDTPEDYQRLMRGQDGASHA